MLLPRKNNFRWTPSVIQWHDFLLLLEGQLVHLSAPKSHYSKYIAFTRDTPIFATGKNPIVFVKNGMLAGRKTNRDDECPEENISFPRTNPARKAKLTTSLWQMLCHFHFGTKGRQVSLNGKDLRRLTTINHD